MIRLCAALARSAWMLVFLAAAAAARASEWTENSFGDFRGGAFLDAGSNLYVSARGRIQIINRWDLNGDGHLDVVMPSGHGHTEKEDIYVYLNRGKDLDGHSLIRVPADGSRDGLVRDLDGDGLNDLAVCNNDNGITSRTGVFVYHGGPGGFTAARRTSLPAHASTGIAAGDFNADGRPDLAVACQFDAGDLQRSAETTESFIYWNSPEGFKPESRTALRYGGRGAECVATADLNGDGRDDLVTVGGGGTHLYYSGEGGIRDFTKSVDLPVGGQAIALGDIDGDGRKDLALCGGDRVTILPAGPDGYAVDRAVAVEAVGAADVALADFDGDGRDDLAVANFSHPSGATWIRSYVYYSNGKDFAGRPRVELPTIGASGVAAGDLNGDGRPDLVIANQRTTNEHSLLSYVYWNDGGTFRYGNHTQLATHGPHAGAIGDVDNDGRPDVVFFNHEGGLRDGLAYTRVYWGDGTRRFTAERSLDIPSHYITSVAHADLDDDGRVDLLMTRGRFNNGIAPEPCSIFIYWGEPEGFSPPSNLTLDRSTGGVRAIDLNRDGYLDLLAGGTALDPSDASRSGIPIFWGSADGFAFRNRTVIPVDTADVRVPLAMDLNLDGFIDLAVQVRVGSVRIYWGDARGFAGDRAADIDLGRADSLMYINGADLNKDGWIDLILPMRQVGHDSELTSFIYYGSAEGFSNARREEVVTYGPYDPAVADFDRDGWLDLFMNSYKGNVTRNRPSLVYWGSPQGFSSRPRAELPTHSGAGAEAADYDGDGWLDILSANHRKDGSTDRPGPHEHQTWSMLYWGGPEGFSPKNRWDFKSIGPHGTNIRDVGNSYDRGLYEDYVSSPHPVPPGERPARIRWSAETPHGTAVAFQVRAADSKDALADAPWRGPDGGEAWVTENGSALGALHGKWLQYRARLITPNGGATPVLTSVTIIFR